MMCQSHTTKLYYVYYFTKLYYVYYCINFIMFIIALVYYCIFMYVLNTSGWQTLN